MAEKELVSSLILLYMVVFCHSCGVIKFQ